MKDQDLERLLRETFADKEKLLDSVPSATRRRRSAAPVLLAAAAVLVVLGGILYGVNRGPDADPAPPVAAAPAGDDAEVWSAAITAVVQQFQPKYKLDTVHLSDRPAVVVEAQGAGRAWAFSAAQKDRIAEVVSTSAHVDVTWIDPATLASRANCVRTRADVSVGRVVDKGARKEVQTRITYNCGHEYWLTYLVEQQATRWIVIGTVGTPGGVLPLPASGCPLKKVPPTNPQGGC
ncbi:hypothetical protein [Kribbella sp. CA-247076]|uniref:hypothetical protein n=1 Tax=Kribbella sp. CA-247076 TaxID=3239941 RepID=UPI003D90DBE0